MRRVTQACIVPSQATYLQDEPILGSALQQIVDAINTAERRRGNVVDGWSYPTPFQANSTSYRVTNDLSGGEDLDSRAPIIRPSRVELDGLESATPGDEAFLLEFEVYGQNVDVELTLYSLDDNAAADSVAAHTLEISCGSSYERRRGYVVVERDPGSGAEAFRVAARAKSATSNGRIIEIVPHEAKMVSVENWLSDLQARGDEWVGLFVDTSEGASGTGVGNSVVDSWDADGAPIAFVSDGADPEMLRDVVVTGVHGVIFGGSVSAQRLKSPAWSFGDSFTAAALFRPDLSDGSARYIFAKYDAALGATLRAYVLSGDLVVQTLIGGSLNNINVGAVTTGEWYDLITTMTSAGDRIIMLNGEVLLESNTGGFTDDNPDVCYLGMRDGLTGAFEGVIALPEFSSAGLTRRELEMYAALRRSRHGRY